MRTQNLTWLAAGTAAAFVLGLSACGGSKPAESTAPITPAAPEIAPAPEPAAPESMLMMVADFSSPDRKNALGGEFGVWASDAPDPKGACTDEILTSGGQNGTGAWKINYDISVDGSYCGTWLRFGNYDATRHKAIVIKAKGEGTFSPDFIVELKVGEGASQKVGRYTLTGLTADWKTFAIPFANFPGLTSMNPLFEMAIVFDKQTCPVKKGVVLIDSIEFE